MALRLRKTTRVAVNNVEPTHLPAAKAGTKPRLRPRPALGDIGNKARGKVVGAKVPLKKEKNVPAPKVEQVKPCKPVVQPEDVLTLQVPASPTLMETSGCIPDDLCQAFSEVLLPVKDVDEDDGDNPMLCSEYVKDIYKYLRQLEAEQPVRPKYLEGKEITGNMRAILIDWLVQVQMKFRLLQETMYLTVAIIDRYLQVSSEQHTLAKYLMELTIVDYEMVHYPPSKIAAAAFCLAQKVLNSGDWNDVLQHYMAYKEDELVSVMQHMAKNIVKVNQGLTKHVTVKNKYTSSKQMKISTISQLRSDVILNLSKSLLPQK
ncbi:G2/mitotic-specific cyclin-B1-like isoform X2 [Callorhinchus milii]|uniref:G2/mitotic-specific cyclin-B1-like isoform X2 n=1 Tax=Callorhinchus milii TaxID=7868 RepID=UPI001C3F7D45|nr:G2/mitotic-specific cyclin-B1-like isoform X2 [Callorhinchus milii]